MLSSETNNSSPPKTYKNWYIHLPQYDEFFFVGRFLDYFDAESAVSNNPKYNLESYSIYEESDILALSSKILQVVLDSNKIFN